MKSILILSTLILTVRSETKSADQKDADSSTLEKFLNPLHYDTNNRYGVYEEEHVSNEDILRRLAGLGYRDGSGMEFSRSDDRLFLGNSDESMKNLGLQYNNAHGHINQDRYRNVEDSYNAYGAQYGRNQDDMRNLGQYLANYRNVDRMRNSGQSYNDAYRQEYGRNQIRSRYQLYNQLLRNIIRDPELIGYVGLYHPRGQKGRYHDFATIGSQQLGYDGRTHYGLRAPITPSLLEVAGRHLKGNRNLFYPNGYPMH